MSKNQPSQPATGGTAVAMMDAIARLLMSKDPEKRGAGLLIAAGLIFLCLGESDPGPLGAFIKEYPAV